MSWLVYHIVSGGAFISGLLAVAAGLVLLWLRRTRRGQIGGRLLLIAGWILAIGAMDVRNPFPVVMTFAFSIWAFAASALPRRTSCTDRTPGGTDFVRPGSLIGISVVAISLFPGLIRDDAIDGWKPGEAIHVIGDSLSAGIGAGEGAPWPETLATRLDAEVINHSQAGATAKSAIEQAERLPPDAFVIVEIGGNDLLGGRSSQDFERDLDALLADVCSDGRRVAMFELPLPPFYFGFGRSYCWFLEIISIAYLA